MSHRFAYEKSGGDLVPSVTCRPFANLAIVADSVDSPVRGHRDRVDTLVSVDALNREMLLRSQVADNQRMIIRDAGNSRSIGCKADACHEILVMAMVKLLLLAA